MDIKIVGFVLDQCIKRLGGIYPQCNVIKKVLCENNELKLTKHANTSLSYSSHFKAY
mgnify:CR=1 FL=1